MSETESDHESDNGIGFFDLVEPAQTRGWPYSFDDVLQVLADEDSAYTHSLELSGVVLELLNRALQCRESGSKEQAIHAFQCLVTTDVVDSLLRLRFRLHLNGSNSQRSSVSCINQILSKLGVLVSFVMNNSDGKVDYATKSQTLRDHMERDSFKAADHWHGFPSALSSDNISPATKRLIIRLLFGVFVLKPDFERSQKFLEARPLRAISTALESIVEDYVYFDSVTGSPIILRDVLDCAFFLSLYSAIEMALDVLEPSLSGDRALNRPYLETHLLTLMDRVLYSVDESQKSTVVATAHTICFCWGKLVPWIWAVWADQRLAGSEVTTALTIRWLETLDCHRVCSSHRKCTLAISYLHENAFVGFIALCDVLAHGVGQLQRHSNSRSPAPHLLGQVCSFLLLILQKAAEGNNHHLCERIRPHVLRVCQSILFLCVSRPKHARDQETSAFQGLGNLMRSTSISLFKGADDNLLELLLTVDREVLQKCLVVLQTDRAAQFSSKVDNVFYEAKSHLSEIPSLPSHIPIIRFALGFLTVLCDAGVRGIILRESVSSFLMWIYNRLIIGDYRNEYGKALLGPMVTALIVAEKYFSPSRSFSPLTEDEGLWRLCLKKPFDELDSNLALAQYIMQSSYPRNWLLILETLGHFRTVILTILRKETLLYDKDVLPLACPTFYSAMIRLLAGEDKDSQVARSFFASSPWTTMFRDDLQRLISHGVASGESRQECHDFRDAMVETGARLLQMLSGHDGPSRVMKATNTKLVLYQSQVMIVTTA